MKSQSIMKCLIAFTTFLLAARFGQGVPVKFEELVGESVKFESERVPVQDFECFLTHNDQNYQLHPVNNFPFGDPQIYIYSCSVSITELTDEHAGEWAMSIVWISNDNSFTNTTKYELSIVHEIKTAYRTLSDEIKSQFSASFAAENGTYVTVFPEKTTSSISKCLLVHFTKNYKTEYDLMEKPQTDPRIELYGACGVRMLVDDRSKTGYWYMLQQIAPFLYEKFEFSIDIPFRLPVYQENRVWLLGFTQEIKMDNSIQSTYCKITQPDNKTILIEGSSCSYHVPKVSRDHEGLWVIHYLLPEKIYSMEKKINVKVQDPGFINVTITYDEGLKLMCRMTRTNSDFCIFTRPDGVAINLPQGIGNDRYEYYGNGYKQHLPDQEADAECGLKIRKPMDVDYGMWKCSLGNRGKIISAIVPLKYTDGSVSEDILPSENIYAKRGDDFTIKCQIYTQLDYCWLLSPNGIVYSVSTNKSYENTLLYQGEGLSLGVCGAKVENASDAHAGNWSCRMGTMYGTEREVPVSVTVTESYLYADQSVINLADLKTSIDLGCNVVPQKEATIRYCRWVRPDGYGIHKLQSNQYSTLQTARTCSLKILDFYSEFNIGNWSCYARLSDDLDTEVFATIKITQNDENLDKINFSLPNISTSTLSIAIICLVTIIPVMFLIAGIILYKKKLCRRRQVNKIDYVTNEIDVHIAQEKPKF